MKRRQIHVLLLMLALGITLAGGAACNRAPGSSPTATMRAFFEATKKKDAEAFKKTLSKGSLEMMENFAKMQNKTLDEALKTGMSDPNMSSTATPEMRNEKINGDTATLEVQNDKSKEFETIPFVRENGEWKIALDKAMREAQEKFSSSHDVK